MRASWRSKFGKSELYPQPGSADKISTRACCSQSTNWSSQGLMDTVKRSTEPAGGLPSVEAIHSMSHTTDLRVHKGAPPNVRCPDNVPGAGRCSQRLLRMAGESDIRQGRGRCSAAPVDSCILQGKSWDLRITSSVPRSQGGRRDLQQTPSSASNARKQHQSSPWLQNSALFRWQIRSHRA